MEKLEKLYIKNHLTNLIGEIRCTVSLLAFLQQYNLLCHDDVEQITEKKVSSAQSLLLLEILQKRSGSFDLLCKGLEETRQTGALKILKAHRLRRQLTYKSSVYLFMALASFVAAFVLFSKDLKGSENMTSLEDSSVRKHYISRKFISRNKLTNKIFRDGYSIYLFLDIQEYQLTGHLNNAEFVITSSYAIEQGQLSSRYIILDQQYHFQEICKMAQPTAVHLVQHNDNRFYWIKSCGSLQKIQENLDKSQTQLSEKSMLEHILQSGPVILSDSPGMGKSTYLQHVYHTIKDKYPDKNVFHAQLKELAEQIDVDISFDTTDVTTSSSNQNLIKLIFNSYLPTITLQKQINQAVILLLDGFDELQPTQIPKVLDFLTYLKSLPSVRIVVTTRPPLLSKLENHLLVLGYNFLPLDTTEQIQLLSGLFKESGEQKNLSLNNSQLISFVEHWLESVNKYDNDDGIMFAGNPLQVRLLSEVIEDEAHKYIAKSNLVYQNSAYSAKAYSFVNLLQESAKKKFNLFFKRTQRDLSLEYLEELHFFQSMKAYFPNYCSSFFNKSKLDKTEVGILLEVGILEVDPSNNNSVQFIHAAYAEHFLALGALNYLKSTNCPSHITKFILENLLRTVTVEETRVLGFDYASEFEYTVATHSLNLLVTIANVENIELGEFSDEQVLNVTVAAVRAKHLGILKLIWPTFIAKSTFCQDSPSVLTNIFTIATAVSSAEILKYFVAFHNFSLHNLHLVRRLGGLVGQYTLLDLAAKRGDYAVFSYLYKVLNFKSILNSSNLQSSLVVHACVLDSHWDNTKTIENKIQIIRLLAKQHPKTLQAKSADGQPALFMCNMSPQLFLELLRYKAVYGLQDSKGNTILHTGLIVLSAEQYYEFIQKISRKLLQTILSATNIYGETPLHSLIAAYDSDPPIYTVKFMLEHGAKINQVDKQNKSVLTTALLYQHSVDFLKFLVDQGAHWFKIFDNQGNYIASALHFAAAWSIDLEVLSYLLSLGSDINQRDSQGKSPLFYAFTTYNYTNYIDILECDIEVPFSLFSKKDGQSDLNYITRLYKSKKTLRLLLAVELRKIAQDVVIKYLIINEAIVNLKNNQEHTALESALINNYSISMDSLLTILDWTEPQEHALPKSAWKLIEESEEISEQRIINLAAHKRLLMYKLLNMFTYLFFQSALVVLWYYIERRNNYSVISFLVVFTIAYLVIVLA